MANQAGSSHKQYSLKLRAYHNCDDVFLCWRTFEGAKADEPIKDNLGFMIERQRQDASGNWQPTEVLRNRVGFKDVPPQDENDNSQPSSIWPFQRYDWTDHGANSSEIVRYRISAMKLPARGIAGTSQLEKICSSEWTDAIKVRALCENGVSAFFNRGAVMSQYVARIARMKHWTPHQIKEHVKELQEPLRRFLSGELRLALLALLDEAINNPSLAIYAALYELGDVELIESLKKLGGRAHVLLANGSKKDGDGNQEAADQLINTIDLNRRMLGSKGLAHNKFVVLYDERRHKPIKVLTGSTNWTASGLCTQLNNAVLFEDEKMARIYFEQWNALHTAQNDFTPALMAHNNASPYPAKGTSVWFTRLSKPPKGTPWARDVQALIDAVNQAQQMILYVMFQPGEQPLETILKKGAEGLYVRGVVSTLTSAAEESFSLAGLDTESKEYQTELIQPEGVGHDFASWIEEVTRKEFLYPNANPGIGHAITHAKMFVIDPFTPNCKVVTGSHNFSKAASTANDEQFVVTKGNQSLAEAYAVACMATYEHYRWRAYLKGKIDAGEKPWSHLSSSPGWQQKYLSREGLKHHLELWCRETRTAKRAAA